MQQTAALVQVKQIINQANYLKQLKKLGATIKFLNADNNIRKSILVFSNAGINAT